jgi:tRNA U55 pseudouridine synthase TruB
MTSLRRLAVGPFTFENSIPFEELDEARLKQSIQLPLTAVASFPRRVVDDDEIRALRQGKKITTGQLSGLDGATEVAVIDQDDNLIAIARFTEDQRLQPQIVLPAQ